MCTSKLQLKDAPLVKEEFSKEDCIINMALTDARTNFRLRRKKTEVKMTKKRPWLLSSAL